MCGYMCGHIPEVHNDLSYESRCIHKIMKTLPFIFTVESFYYKQQTTYKHINIDILFDFIFGNNIFTVLPVKNQTWKEKRYDK